MKRSNPGRNTTDDGLNEAMNRSIPVHPAVRIGSAVFIVLGGTFLVLFGAIVMLTMPGRPVPHPFGASLLGLAMTGMGVGFVCVGSRLMRSRAATSDLLGSRARTATGLVAAALALLMALGAQLLDENLFAVGAVFLGLFAYAIFRSVRGAL